MPRIFTGLELERGVRDALALLATPLAGARWVEAADLHVTLRFAGDVGTRQVRDFADELARIDQPAFVMRMSGLGAFGGNDPHTIFAEIDPNPELDQLARAHDKAARAAGLKPETRKFKGHVTLARLRGGDVRQVAHLLERHAGYKSGPIAVEHFVLFSARPGVGGGPYAIEETFDLAGSSRPYAQGGDRGY